MVSVEALRQLSESHRYGPRERDERMRRLEASALHVLREMHRVASSPAMLWSVGKDSSVLIWLTLKAFLGEVPFPLVHVDTGFKPPELLAFRERMCAVLGVEVRVLEPGPGPTFPDGRASRVECCHRLKSEPIRAFIASGFDAVVSGIRADEHGTRAKERIFSPRREWGTWDVERQPMEAWELAVPNPPQGGHLRVHPLLEWTERDIWRYIEAEEIPVVELYFASVGRRYRTLGCMPCTGMVLSSATTIAEVLAELEVDRTCERATRLQDQESEYAFEDLRRKGYL